MTTPQPFSLPDLGPGLEEGLQQSLEAALQQIAADPTVQALVLFGSRATGTARISRKARPSARCGFHQWLPGSTARQ